MLALPPINPDEYDGPVVCGTVCTFTRSVEPAGRCFHNYQLFRLNYNKGPAAESKKSRNKGKNASNDSDSDEEVIDAAAEKRRAAEYEKKRKAPGEANRLRQALEGENLYDLLKIDHGASTEEIRLAYRKAALLYHPDKAKSSEDPAVRLMTPDQLKAKFLSVQDGFELLTNPATRRMYDSQLPFDETIPKEDELYINLEAFIERFNACFQRNARFSIRRPVPSIGDAKSSERDLDKFYNFWRGFQSWRDFSIHDEYDLNDAECREERRWMERKNKKTKEKYEIAEKTRIRNLIDLCEKKDPRMIVRREKEQAEKDAAIKAKQDAYEAKKRAEEEAKAAEIRRKEEEERIEAERVAKEKQEREENKARVKVFRGLVRRAHGWLAGEPSAPSFDEVQEEILLVATPDELAVLIGELSVAARLPPMPDFPETLESVGGGADEKKAVAALLNSKVNAALESRKQQAEEKKRQLEEQKKLIEERKAMEDAAKKQAAEWTVDELSLLAKALVRFPAGVNRRWMMIADMLGTRSADEVVAKAREMQDTSKTLKSMSEKVNSNSFALFQQHNPNALKKIATHIDIRGTVGTNDLDLAPVDRPTLEEVEPTTPAPAAAAAAAAAAAVVPEADWTKEQQTQLEKALAKYPATMAPNERWTAIAGEVDGKSKKECAARFKYIKEMIAAKKAASS